MHLQFPEFQLLTTRLSIQNLAVCAACAPKINSACSAVALDKKSLRNVSPHDFCFAEPVRALPPSAVLAARCFFAFSKDLFGLRGAALTLECFVDRFF